MHTFTVVPIILALSSFTSANPLKCAPASSCHTTITETKTRTIMEKETITIANATTTHIVTASGTSTLSPACPLSSTTTTTTHHAKRSASTSPKPTTSTLTSQIAAPSSCTSTCSSLQTHTTTLHDTTTQTTTHTKTLKTYTSTQTTYTASVTPSSAYFLQSSLDPSTYAYPDTSYESSEGYFTIIFTSCSASSAVDHLFALNTSSSELIHSSTGYIASNAASPGATGETLSFSSPADLDNQYDYPAALACSENAGLIGCGLQGSGFSGDEWEVCGGDLCWGGQSHLCEAVDVRLVEPRWV